MVTTVTDREALRTWLMRDPALHLYELGDLDDFFWPHTRWYALGDAIALVYDAPAVPAVLAFGEPAQFAPLLAELRDLLPRELYAHLSPGLYASLAPRFASESHGVHVKMMLADPAKLPPAAVEQLRSADREELERFFAGAYPGNWFDARMLETGHYVAVREPEIVASAGVHVCSPTDRVAALGNIAVSPARRGAGLGRRVTAGACHSLLAAGIDRIGLNVRADNDTAVALYTSLGFTVAGQYELHHLMAR
ncbi:MAG TPA: GNAT family N-acetyltransferase [Kofleriaceae bacterium]